MGYTLVTASVVYNLQEFFIQNNGVYPNNSWANPIGLYSFECIFIIQINLAINLGLLIFVIFENFKLQSYELEL